MGWTVVASLLAASAGGAARPVCARCARPASVCICASLPTAPLHTRTRVLVLQHGYEKKRRKVVSSVPLIGLSLRDCAVVESAGMALAELNRAIADDFTPLLLFPDHDAAPLDASALELSTHKEPDAAEGVAEGLLSPLSSPLPSPLPSPLLSPLLSPLISPLLSPSRRYLLFLVDGTWRQAHHLLRGTPALAASATKVMFTDEIASIWSHVRQEPAPFCVSTLEACARALRLVEPSAAPVADHMEESFRLLVAKQLSHAKQRGAPRDTQRRRGGSRPRGLGFIRDCANAHRVARRVIG